MKYDRITMDSGKMGGRPCIRAMRLPAKVVGMLGAGHSKEQVLQYYAYLEEGDIVAALRFASETVDFQDSPVAAAQEADQ